MKVSKIFWILIVIKIKIIFHIIHRCEMSPIYGLVPIYFLDVANIELLQTIYDEQICFPPIFCKALIDQFYLFVIPLKSLSATTAEPDTTLTYPRKYSISSRVLGLFSFDSWSQIFISYCVRPFLTAFYSFHFQSIFRFQFEGFGIMGALPFDLALSNASISKISQKPS